MKTHGSMIPIGALNYEKMKSCKYLKEGNFAILKEIYWLVFERIKKRAKYFEVGFVFKETNKRGWVEMH